MSYHILYINNIQSKNIQKTASAKILRNDATLSTPSFHSFTRTPRRIDRGSGRDAKGISRNLVWDTCNQLDHHWLRNNRWLQKKNRPPGSWFRHYLFTKTGAIRSRWSALISSDLVHLMKLISSNFKWVDRSRPLAWTLTHWSIFMWPSYLYSFDRVSK